MLTRESGYRRTMTACFLGYIVQATICTLAPLLYARFQTEYQIPLGRISLMITLTFAIQLLVDLASSFFVDRIGYRRCIVAAHFLAMAGFLLMAFLPDLTADPYTGLLIATLLYSAGAGLIEVLVSPIIDACPTERKSAAMNLLHSFFSWGQVAVVLLSTLFFRLFGIGNWRILCCLWAILPLCNAFLFLCSPMPLVAAEESAIKGIRPLLHDRRFWLIFVIMFASGATEITVSQWASTMIETELGVSKTVGDLAGPCLFALFMALGRMLGTRFDDKSIGGVVTAGAVLCICSYLLIALAPWPWLSLAGCALCGLAVSVAWPGALCMAAAAMRGAGTALFGLLALAGDIGCTSGPSWAGIFAERFGGQLKLGILCAIVFPVVLLAATFRFRHAARQRR